MDRMHSLPRPAEQPNGFRIVEAGGVNPLIERLEVIDDLHVAIRHSKRRALIRNGQAKLEALAQARKSETCVIAGNGPSLNRVDWDQLDGLDVLAANYAADHAELSKHITLLSVVNPWVISQRPDAFHTTGYPTVMPYYLALWAPENSQHITLDAHGHFAPATHAKGRFSTRSTVSYFNLQLALCLGYKKVLLIGFDHSYEQPLTASEGDYLVAADCDPNHFSSDYFAHRVWQAADTERMEVAYAYASIHYQRRGATVINCTDESQLRIFPRFSFTDALSLSAPVFATTTGEGNRLSKWLSYIDTPQPRAIRAGTALLSLVVGLLGALAGSSLVDSISAGILCGATTAGGILLITGSISTQRHQSEDDQAEISACLNRANRPTQTVEQQNN